MRTTAAESGELVRRGQGYCDRFLRSKLEPAHRGGFLYPDVETGQYELDADEVAPMECTTANHPDSTFYIFRVGNAASAYLGAQLQEGRA
ncbi:MAG: hypothetical protein FJ291_18145 [Planctomycetes bacterium]|nr:hypothetical protein [Planctomycetota bacterium]